MRRGSRHRDRTLDYHAPIHCVEHDVDLAAVQRFVDDGRPAGAQVTIDAINGGECPACRRRYVAGWRNGDGPPSNAGVNGPPGADSQGNVSGAVSCACCRSHWELEGTGWVASVDGGLQITGQPAPIPAGKVIDSSWFVVQAIDPVEAPEPVLRGAFLAFDASTQHPAADDLVEDVTASMLACYNDEADEQAELGRITLEHGLREEAADGWASTALAALGVVRALHGDDVEPHSSGGAEHAGIVVSRARFSELVVQALDSIPPELARRMENVAVIVEAEAKDRRLFGLYVGVPLTKRTGYGHTAPDLITIYQNTISEYSDTEDDIVDQVRRTVIHEVAHHFGISDPRLRELGW